MIHLEIPKNPEWSKFFYRLNQESRTENPDLPSLLNHPLFSALSFEESLNQHSNLKPNRSESAESDDDQSDCSPPAARDQQLRRYFCSEEEQQKER